MRWPGRVLVTGSNRGLGLEFVRQYAAAGSEVVATCRAPETADDLRAIEGAVRVAPLDVRSDDDLSALVDLLDGDPLDLVISNAAVLGGRRSRLDDLDRRAWARAFEINVIGAVRVPLALRANLVRGDDPRLVVMGSRAGLPREARAGTSYIYRSTKAALVAAFRILALDLVDEGIVTTMLNPGHVRTGIGGRNAPTEPPDSVRQMREVIGRLTPSDAGRFLSFDGTELAI